MTRIELNEMRLRCRAMLDAYHIQLAALCDDTKAGARPTPSAIQAEQQALYELMRIRRAYLEALARIGPVSAGSSAAG